MIKELTKKEAEQKIKEFFQREMLDAKETKKIKRLAMKYRIKLTGYKKAFCKKCFCDLRAGNTRINNGHKTVVCSLCGFVNKWKIK